MDTMMIASDGVECMSVLQVAGSPSLRFDGTGL